MGLRKTAEVLGVLVLLVAVATHTVEKFLCLSWQGSLWSGFYGLLSVILAAGIVICADIIRLNPADSHTAKTLLSQYFSEGTRYVKAWQHRNFLFSEARDMKRQQERVFNDIMTMNKDTAYGRSLKLGEVRDIDDFRRKVPFTKFTDIDPFIDRMLEGEDHMVTTNHVNFMCFTSGTTGKNKTFPAPKQVPVQEFVCSIYYSVAQRLGRSLGRPIMLFHAAKVRHTKQGIPIMPLSVAAYPHEPYFLTPKCVYDIVDEQPFMHCAIVFSLRDPEMNGVRAIYASMMYTMWNQIDAKWEQFCDDVERGEIKSLAGVSDSTLREINSFLEPAPERAAILRREFKKGMKGIARRIWPRMYWADMICSGSLAQCAKLMSEREMHGVPILSCFFAASECMGGLNTSEEIDETRYTLYTPPYFFEWIPEDNTGETNPDTLLTYQLEVGKRYEIVLTSHAGLTRYRLGDVFHIAKKIEQCPVFEFSHRAGQVLDMAGEKVTEAHFANMIITFFEKKGLQLIDYTACESVHLKTFDNYDEIFNEPANKPQCYLIFVDVKEHGDRKNYLMPNDFGAQFDKYFCEHTDLYNWQRGGALGQMKMVQVEPIAFQEMKEAMIRETQTQQYKVPRAMRRPDILKILLSRIIKNDK